MNILDALRTVDPDGTGLGIAISVGLILFGLWLIWLAWKEARRK